MDFSRQGYRVELTFPTPGDLPDLGIEPDTGIKPESPALAGRFFTTEPSGKPFCYGTQLPFFGGGWDN